MAEGNKKAAEGRRRSENAETTVGYAVRPEALAQQGRGVAMAVDAHVERLTVKVTLPAANLEAAD